MRDRRSERAGNRALGIYMNPLQITGCRGKRIDLRLVDRDPFADTQYAADVRGKVFEPIRACGAQG